MSKPFVAAAEKNKDAILDALRGPFANVRRVLEIGAGSAQHAVHFARALPHLVWQASDLPYALAGMRAWIEEAALPNLPPPVVLDVLQESWPCGDVDAVYAANTVHFMPYSSVEMLFERVAALLPDGGLLALYGPFNYGGRYVSEGNRALDEWLKTQDPAFAIRDFEALVALAARHGLELVWDVTLPANNHLLVWRANRAPARA